MPVKEVGSLIDQYKKMHEAGHFLGFSTVEHAPHLAALIKETGSKSVLDFGCGKGHQYSRYGIHETWGLTRLQLYDPAVPGFTEAPEPADGVICCDVMEHIPEEEVEKVLKQVIGLARKFVFFVICTRPSKKNLPDGRNCHITIKPREWWEDAIRKWKREGLPVIVEYRDSR